MSEENQIRDLLVEIRDNQRLSLQRQEEHLAIAREQIERSRGQIEESVALQRQALDRVKRVSRVAIPGIVFCIAAILYLVFRYF